jgi:hypothetical protein
MTAPAKRLGDGVIVKIDGTAVACLRKVTPPEDARDEVDATCIGDAFEDFLDTPLKKAGMVTLDLVWQPGAVNSELIDTAFNQASPSARVVTWAIEYRMFSTIRIATFTGFIKSLKPLTLENKVVVGRTVEIRQKTAVVWTTGT